VVKKKKNIITPSAGSSTLLRIEASSNDRSVWLVTQQLIINDGVAQANHLVPWLECPPGATTFFGRWSLEELADSRDVRTTITA
jgi:hypothetical protein